MAESVFIAGLFVLAANELAGIAEHRGDAAVRALSAAAAMETRMKRPSARPHPIKPAHELLGEALPDLDRPREAIAAFERALWWAPNRSRAVLGLARALAKNGDRAAARTRYTQFLKNWASADSGRAELDEARRYVR